MDGTWDPDPACLAYPSYPSYLSYPNQCNGVSRAMALAHLVHVSLLVERTRLASGTTYHAPPGDRAVPAHRHVDRLRQF